MSKYRVFDECIRLDFPAAGEPVWISASTDMPTCLSGLTMLLDDKTVVFINMNKNREEIDLAFLHELNHVLHKDHRKRCSLDVGAAEKRTHAESEADLQKYIAGKSGPTIDMLKKWKKEGPF